MSGAPEDSNANSPPSGISRGDSAIIHRTVRCTPDSVRCAKEGQPQELASFGKSATASPLKFTGLSGVHRTVRCDSGATAISAPTAPCSAFNARSALAEGRRTHSGAPDNEQELSGVHRTPRQGPQVRSFNGQNPTAVMTWRGHRTCPVRHRADSLPTATFGGWGYKYPNHPTIHCIQVLYFPTTTRALAFNSRHTKEIKSSPYSTQRPSD
jgi:hypothetical protein